MDQTVDERAPEQAGLQRRTLLKGAAWSVPAVLLVGATPAFAASNTPFAFTSLVAVPALATPALINATNSEASVKVSGEGPDNAFISVSVGSYSANPAPQVTSGKWEHTIPASSLPEGTNVLVTAALGTNSATKTYTKDIAAPAPTINSSGSHNNQQSTFTVSGTMGTAATPTADSSTGTLYVVSGGQGTATNGSSHSVTRQSNGTWSLTFTGVADKPGVGKTPALTLRLTQTDGATNAGVTSDIAVRG